MLDGMIFGSNKIGGNVSESYNDSPRMPAVSRGNIGLQVQNRQLAGGEVGGDFYGRLSVGILELGVVALIAMYLWTRNVQGGG